MRGDSGAPPKVLLRLAERLEPGAVGRREALFDRVEALFHALPPCRDQVDEQGQVVEPSVPFCLHLARERLEPPDRQAGEPTHLRQLACHGCGLVPHAVADGPAHLFRQGGLELGAQRGEGLDPPARPLERRLDFRIALCSLLDRHEPRLRPLDRGLSHGRNASVAVG